MNPNIYHRTYGLARDVLRRILPPRPYYFLRDLVVPDEVYCCYKMLENSSNDPLMIDVGAHVGGSLIKFALSGWTVHAFEPDDQNRKKLKRLCERENFTNVCIDSRAVSDKNERKLSYYRSYISSGISGLSAFDESHEEVQQVESVTLASYCNHREIEKVDFLKIDAEGWDYYVLKGFPFMEINPTVILTEFENAKTSQLGYQWQDLAELLRGHGYMVAVSEWYPIVQYGGKHKFRSISTYPCELIDNDATGNLIASLNLNDHDQLIKLVNKHLK